MNIFDKYTEIAPAKYFPRIQQINRVQCSIYDFMRISYGQLKWNLLDFARYQLKTRFEVSECVLSSFNSFCHLIFPAYCSLLYENVSNVLILNAHQRKYRLV